MHLNRGLTDEELVSQLAEFKGLRGDHDTELGFYLQDFDSRGLYRNYGCSSSHHFALARLQIPPRKTHELLHMTLKLTNQNPNQAQD